MGGQKTQYKRNPKLKAEFEEHFNQSGEHLRRLSAWKKVLLDNPAPEALTRIADLLSRLGFAPDEQGRPVGDWPPIANTDPLVYLDSLAEYVSSNGRRETTVAWKADILAVATLLWAGAIDAPDSKDMTVMYPRASATEVYLLLLFADLESFWGRRGVGKAKADIREMWERGEDIVAPKQLQDALRRARGGGT